MGSSQPFPGGSSPLPPSAQPGATQSAADSSYSSFFPAGSSYYSKLLALSSGPEDHFFANLHAVLRDFMDVPILVAATADVTTPDGYRLQYQRNMDERDSFPVIDRK
jgi:hypothetical protein